MEKMKSRKIHLTGESENNNPHNLKDRKYITPIFLSPFIKRNVISLHRLYQSAEA